MNIFLNQIISQNLNKKMNLRAHYPIHSENIAIKWNS